MGILLEMTECTTMAVEIFFKENGGPVRHYDSPGLSKEEAYKAEGERRVTPGSLLPRRPSISAP